MSDLSPRKFPAEEADALASGLSYTDAYRVLANLICDVFGVVDDTGVHWIDFDRDPADVNADALITSLRQEFLPDDDDDNDDDDPTEPDEEDLITEDHVHFYSHGGPRRGPVVTVPEGEDWKVVVKKHMDEERFWPNVWSLSDHGNWCLLSLTDEEDEP